MLSQQIRSAFLGYFQEREHLLVRSAPLIPEDDPSLLLVSAGMVPFKSYFLGQRDPPKARLTSCQKAFRATDIDEVGDLSHDTFFEMLGNFSFGAYFKEEAIGYAFELLTRTFGLDQERLHPSVHPSDEVSAGLWERVADIPSSRVARLEENFWQAGPTGPCGVDSEIYYDLGERFGSGPDERPGRGERYLEIWNLVFMDAEQLPDGRTVPLGRPGVDTGMGLERMAMVLQGCDSIFETDLFAPILEDFAERAGALPRGTAEQRARHLRRLADHARGACMLIADGVLPGNEGRGYVLRRLLRRALVSSITLEVEGGLAPTVPAVVGVLGTTYPELAAGEGQVRAVIEQEEARFQETLVRGQEQFEAALARAEGRVIRGPDAFRLHDTFGFPLELTEDLASARGFAVDLAGVEVLLQRQREQARAGRPATVPGSSRAGLPATEFVGYDQFDAATEVVMLLKEGVAAESAGVGEEVEVILASSPFYAEGGGQLGDRGQIAWDEGLARVLDTTSPQRGVRVNRCAIDQGELRNGIAVRAAVDREHRAGCAAHHSTTHLLNAALRRQLGEGVVQRGSLVSNDRATFDFSWPRPLADEELLQVERELNLAIRSDLVRRVEMLSLEDARRSGALALPEETYGEQVRVVSFGDVSRELCGGTHVERSGEIGAAVLTAEHSVGSGLRRIELVAGPAAELWWEEQRGRTADVARQLRAPLGEVGARVKGLQARVRELERDLAQARRQGAGDAGRPVRETIGGITFSYLDLAETLPGGELLRRADQLLEETGTGGAVILAGTQFVLKLSPELGARGLSAGQIARAACQPFGGGGGNEQLGRGGLTLAGHAAALATVRTILGSSLEEA
ncbi:MAG TPA: alanine--tRNA ligase [Candidatus Dormibacteraeota bacterium]